MDGDAVPAGAVDFDAEQKSRIGFADDSVARICSGGAFWLVLLDATRDRKHAEQVAFLKSGHKLGHDHANALVVYHRALARKQSARQFPTTGIISMEFRWRG